MSQRSKHPPSFFWVLRIFVFRFLLDCNILVL
ncbi:hypothetical protein ACFX13_022575 [Malus domestica]